MNAIIEKLYYFCEWISKLAHISLLWFVFTLLGFGIFGIMPATSALFSVCRKWVQGEHITQLNKIYWTYYKRDFKEINFVGFIFFIIGLILIINFNILFLDLTTLPIIISLSTFIIAFIYLCLLINFFPVFVHYDISLFNCFKHALLITFIQPIRTLSMLFWFMFVSILSLFLPIFIPFFTIGLIGLGFSWISLSGYAKISNHSNAI